MANGNPRKGGPDVVMGSRHLLGVFAGVVVLCGVFFTLGYVMGRSQYDSSVRAALAGPRSKPASEGAAKPRQTTAPELPKPSEWTFPRAGEPKAAEGAVKPAESKPAVSETASPLRPAASGQAAPASGGTRVPAAKTAGSKPFWKAPLIPRGAIVLQVAALTRDTDALALAEALQEKEYPAFVLTPSADNLYRVQVGPYADAQSAEMAKRSLEREGFKTITKR